MGRIVIWLSRAESGRERHSEAGEKCWRSGRIVRCTTDGSWSEEGDPMRGDPMRGDPRVRDPHFDRVLLRCFIREIARLHQFTETGITFKP